MTNNIISPENLVYKKPTLMNDTPMHYCPGCSHGVVHKLVAEVIEEMGMEDKAVGICPVGCAVFAYRYLDIDWQEAAHGRALACASAVKRLWPDRLVFTYQGDGDLACIGACETIHALNRGEHVAAIFINNAIYGMTGGQMAPTTLLGQKTSTCPYGRQPDLHGYPLNITELASHLQGTCYVSRQSVENVASIRKAKKAIRKALDYSGIRMICGDGTLTPYSIIQDGFMGSKGTRPDDYTNIEEAKQLLADAGYPDGFDVDMTVSDLDMEGILLTDLAQKVKDDLSQIGINVNITTEAWAAGYGDAYRNGTLGFTVMYWGVDYSDPNVQLEFLPGGTVGQRAGWTAEMNPELAAMYQEAMEATDNDARTQVLENIQDAMYEDGPFIVIAQAPAHIAHSNRLDGVDIFDSYTIDLTEINVK